MKSIPVEIDELMWGIAEAGDLDAIRQFESRHPDYKYELNRRVKSVEALRKEGKSFSKEIPIFKTTEVRPPNFRPVFIGAGAICLLLLIPALWVAFSNRTPAPQPAPQIVVLPNPNLSPSESKPEQTQVQPQPIQQTNPVDPNQVAQNPPVNSSPPPVAEPTEKRTSMKLSGASLHSAIQLIAEAGGFRITIAPELHNPDVSIDYQDKTVMEMLRELGQEYAFTVLADGEKELIALPLKDQEPTEP